MNPERWSTIKKLFEDATGRPPEERPAFLDEACAGDTALRREVDSLLDFDRPDAELFARPVAEVLGEMAPRAPAVGRRFGAYRVEREIGRGGMAVVYAAVRDDDQYEKQVAIKLIKRGMDTDAIVARFLNERQILANLEHPNIARLLDGGVSDDGAPYLVMECIVGEPIDAYCERRQLGTDERLKLFRTVCAAVHYAHQNLVVHRDLKPSNILITREGAPKLLDFGIAKLLAPEPGGERFPPTAAGLRPMTPEYASPEQVRGRPVTTASDVYALGVLLYQLLTRRRPYRLESLTPREIERVVCEETPGKPSTAAGRADGGLPETAPIPAASAIRLRRRLAGDLDTIVLKAMHKDPGRRFSSAAQLSEDLRRHLSGQPVTARKDTLPYRAGKFVNRHRWGVAAAGLLILSLLGGIVATSWQAREARRERVVAEEVSKFLLDLFENTHPEISLGREITVREVLDQGARMIPYELEGQPRLQAAVKDVIGNAFLKLGSYEQAELWLEEALEIRRQELGDPHPEVAESLNHLGELRSQQGKPAEAETLHRKALAIRLEGFGEVHELAAQSRNNLALALHDQGATAEAEEELLKAREIQRQVYSGDHEDLAITMNNLALVWKSQGRSEEADELYRQALEVNRRVLGEGHPVMVTVLNNLAQSLRQQGECGQALEHFREALQLEIRLKSDDHPDIAIIQNNLAVCLKDLGDYSAAEGLFQRSHELRREALGHTHPVVADSLNNLASLYYARGDYVTAEETYREALDIQRRHPESESLGTTLSNWASTLRELGNDAAAEDAQREALEIHLRILDDEHFIIARDRHSLGAILHDTNRLEEAGLEFQRAFEIRRKWFGDDHVEVAESLLGWSLVLSKTTPAEDAEPVLREALGRWQRLPGEHTHEIGILKTVLGVCLKNLGQFEEARRLLEESYEAIEDERTLHHLEVLDKLEGKG